MAQANAIRSETNERQLAAAVFHMALEDLTGYHQGHRRSALSFLLRDEADFSFWCQQLNVDPQAFRERLRQRIFGPHKGLSDLRPVDCTRSNK